MKPVAVVSRAIMSPSPFSTVDLEGLVLAVGVPMVALVVAEEAVAMEVLVVEATLVAAVLLGVATEAEELPTMLEATKTTALGQVLAQEASLSAWPIDTEERICFY